MWDALQFETYSKSRNSAFRSIFDKNVSDELRMAALVALVKKTWYIAANEVPSPPLHCPFQFYDDELMMLIFPQTSLSFSAGTTNCKGLI